MKHFRTILLSLVMCTFIVTPFFAHAFTATNGVFPTCNQPTTQGKSVASNGNFINDGQTGSGQGCGWADLVQLAGNLLNYIILLAMTVAAVTFAYAGFLILTASGDEGKVKEAKGMFMKVAIGLFWVCGAWLVVHFILLALVGDASYSIINNSS